jgi:transposase-like protein
VICLDGCHIKTKFGGQLLTAVGVDPNDCIFPIAFAVVEVESKITWKCFLETLKQDLNIQNTYPWTVMTNKQKGLIPAVQEVFPDLEHRFCVRHLYQNFSGIFKGENIKNQLWAWLGLLLWLSSTPTWRR